MDGVSDPTRSILLQRVQDDLSRAQQKSAYLSRIDIRLVTGSLVATALATVLAGATAAMGPLVGQGPPAWRWTCGAIALITAVAGVLTGAHQRFGVAERLASVRSCTSQLRALELRMGMGNADVSETARRYEELIGQYPELYT